jgi:hypothetical protein
LACNWVCPVLMLTLHLDVPDAAQTENAGLRLDGFADSVTLAVPLPLLSQTQIAYVTLVCGSTALTPSSVCIFKHSVPGGGDVVGVVVGVGVGEEVVGVAVGVAFVVPPGVGFAELLFGAGCGNPLGAGPAEPFGLGWGSGGLELWLGWVLGSGIGDWLAVCVWLAEALPAAWFPCAATEACPADACVPVCLLSWTAWASSTGMPAGCGARAPVWAAVLTSGLAAEAGLMGAADAQGFELAWRVPCTPVSSMLTAP